ncbi:mucolipin-3 isoform X6 [Danio rerio]|uniref:Mucolipin-3 isoform X6 n=1 Tax=Danio rerio TaxID=7955 RepID=A0AC58IMY7_DANRE
MDDSREDYLCINDPNGNWSECEAHVDPALEAFRRKLKYFFMNPCDKYKARQRKPWKLFLQIVKIAVVTVQLVSFGLSNQMVVQFKEENLLTFRHLFLKNYSESNTNTYAIYTQLDVYTHITHIVQQFLMLPSITVGNHEYEQEGDVYTPLCICQQFYHNGSISPANETFDIDSRVDQECSLIYPQDPFTESPLNFTLHFERLLSVTVNFTLKAINLETVEYHELPDCYVFNIMIQFDNKAHSGRILVDLDNEVHIYECSDWSMTGASRNMYMMVLFDAVVILILSTSLLLCIRSVKAGVLLQKEYSEFSLRRYRKCVSLSERLEFINGWYLLIIVSDVLTISGSVLKIVIQLKAVASYDLCSILLGTGTMLVWIGVLRYMGYLKKYNVRLLFLLLSNTNIHSAATLLASHSCCRFVGCTSMMPISRSTTSQSCSIGLSSGDCGGHLSTVNSSSCSRNQSEMTCCVILLEVAIRRWRHCAHKGMDMVSSNTQVGCGVDAQLVLMDPKKISPTPLHHHHQPEPLTQGRMIHAFMLLRPNCEPSI